MLKDKRGQATFIVISYQISVWALWYEIATPAPCLLTPVKGQGADSR